MVFRLVILLVLWGMAGTAEAACSGSGLSWTCTAGSTATQINNAISNASNTATITLQNGTYSATGISLTPRNGVSVVCQSVGGCTMTGAGQVFGIEGFGTVTNLMRISGFNFTGSGIRKIWVWSADGNSMRKLRIDNNDFTNVTDTAILLGTAGGGEGAKVAGLIDHNNCHGATNFLCMWHTGGPQDATQWIAGVMGTDSASSLYFEDNICNFSDLSDVATGCIDVYHAIHVVARFNTVTNGILRQHGMCHYGPMGMEVYGNDIRNSTSSGGAVGYRNIHLQGSGEIMAFGNIVDPISPFSHYSIEFQHHRSAVGAGGNGDCVNQCDGTRVGGDSPASPTDGNRSPIATYRGYPCWKQPGRDKNATLKPMYFFKNRRANGTYDSLIVGRESDDYLPQHLVNNRDYYIGTSMTANSCTSPGVNCTPFTGASGVGHGTLANRPNTCTPTSEALDAGNGGVGYWATDQGTWKNGTPSQGVDVDNGVLYRCSATNTWTVAYTPYTYPHPLGGSASSPPAAPTNVRVAQAD